MRVSRTDSASTQDWLRPALGLTFSACVNLVILIILGLIVLKPSESRQELTIQVTIGVPQPVTTQVQIEPSPNDRPEAKDDSDQVDDSSEDASRDRDAETRLFELAGSFSDAPPDEDSSKIKMSAAGGTGSSGSNAEGSGPPQKVQYFGLAINASRIAYVIDGSDSMKGRRFGRAKKELIESIDQLDPTQSFRVVFFTGSSTVSFPPDEKLVPATKGNLIRFKRWIGRFYPRGGTYPARAISTAVASNPDVVFFLTDGIIPGHTVDVAARASPDRTKIHTVGFTTRSGEELLRQIAENSGGRYRFVK